ncbi:MAG: NAD-binding protein, partial [Firmicutes bacterium]|nr:NAD-binding protein [Bacillota bacterium]
MKSILLIGTNRFGSLLARQFQELGHQVMAVDKEEERINSILPYVTEAQIGDSTNEAFL